MTGSLDGMLKSYNKVFCCCGFCLISVCMFVCAHTHLYYHFNEETVLVRSMIIKKTKIPMAVLITAN